MYVELCVFMFNNNKNEEPIPDEETSCSALAIR